MAGEGFPFTRCRSGTRKGRPAGSMAATTEHRLTTGKDENPGSRGGPK